MHVTLNLCLCWVETNRKLSLKIILRGGSRIFSRGVGVDFQKKFENFDDLFFRSTKLIFRALKQYENAVLANFSAPQANF